MGVMTTEQWRAFLLTGSRTAKLATISRDGRPSVVAMHDIAA
jgi:hypothetical protein